ncbi:MAG: aspartate kinase [Verrucomicrobiota bacterium]
MALIVQKFGGTSVGSAERIRNVAARILATQQEGHQVVAVVSAMGGVTNRLVELAHEVSSHPLEKEMDVLLSTGEQQTIALTSMAIAALGGQAVSYTGRQAGILTTSAHTRARIEDIDGSAVQSELEAGKIVILAGFQGLDREGRITTLGRGGSDLTAIAMAAALQADRCQIFTDVEGVFTCDPRLVKDARKLDEIAYDEMLEMASSGTKVMQSRSVEFAQKYGVPFEVRSSLADRPGTLVTEEHPNMEQVVIRGISIEKDQANVVIREVPDTPGSAGSIFRALAEADVNVDMIIQNVSNVGKARISFTLPQNDLERAREVMAPLLENQLQGAHLEAELGIAKLSAVGIGMRSHSGVAAKMFGALSDAGINIQMISTSEIKIAVIVNQARIEEAAHVVHQAFDLHKEPA